MVSGPERGSHIGQLMDLAEASSKLDDRTEDPSKF